jgi:prepilin-type N-terminal cleavage/methylation domain-containing protein
MKKALSKNGFTLIELTLVTVILVVIGLSIYGTFANGINIWKKVTGPSVMEDVALFFEKASYDLRNSFKMTGLRFRGSPAEMSFPTKIKHYDEQEGFKDSIGRVTYSFNRNKKTVTQERTDYSGVYLDKSVPGNVLVRGVSSLRFEYYVFDARQKKYSWVTNWQEREESFGIQIEENIPLMVRIELGLADDGVEQKFVKLVSIPSACCWPFVEE